MPRPLLDANTLLEAGSLELEYEDVPADQIVQGAPRTGHAVLSERKKYSVGVWEMTAGAMSDTEADEFFIVIAGTATVRFLDDGSEIELGPGDVVHLSDGARTVWTVPERLRKVYVS